MDNPDNNSFYIYNLCGITALVVLIFDLNIALGVAGGVPYILVVLISLWMPERRFTIIVAVICSCLTIIGFYFSPEGGELWKVLFNRGLALFAIWVTAILTLQRKNVELQYQAALEEKDKTLDKLKILQDIIPTCTSCRKICDQNGNWEDLDNYIQDHSKTNITHLFCPDCTAKFDPEHDLNAKRNTNPNS
ncbi:MAG: hypothetical protein OEY89_10635 [Gammaproteobacteria bacterium]|nr:hypothetical protein [Gammaproteobacteria bacterium]